MLNSSPNHYRPYGIVVGTLHLVNAETAWQQSLGTKDIVYPHADVVIDPRIAYLAVGAIEKAVLHSTAHLEVSERERRRIKVAYHKTGIWRLTNSFFDSRSLLGAEHTRLAQFADYIAVLERTGLHNGIYIFLRYTIGLKVIDKQAYSIISYTHIAARGDVSARVVLNSILACKRIAGEDGVAVLTAGVIDLEVEIRIRVSP